ncbi:MAG: hypothetical protein A2498_15710 [Lentisphaerae bacterium RIFOXYC12_FULL_60_16]|nr:MAG: hypothetical protein A2498_15710 [Lentisphaerae bacterium RIFOXYC12_FULL_60_16]
MTPESSRTQYRNNRFRKYRIGFTKLLGFVLLLALILAKRGTVGLVTDMLYFIGVILVAIGTLGRLWCSLYIAGRKTTELVTVGPYSVSRHPLYFFSFVGALGVGLATETVTIPILFLIFGLLYYPSILRIEESLLIGQYGDAYLRYKQRTPGFLPRWSILVEPATYEVNPRVFLKHVFSALWFIWFLGILELLESFQEYGFVANYYTVY